MKFESERLILRDYLSDDWERVHLYGSVPEFSQFEMWGPNSEEDSKNFVTAMVAQSQHENRWKFDFAICLKENGLLIGGAGIRREGPESRVANLGWAINPEFQNQGYATEAARRLVKFGFHDLDLYVIYATCDARNLASAKVMEKLEMVPAGCLAGDKMVKGHLRDTLRFELFR